MTEHEVELAKLRTLLAMKKDRLNDHEERIRYMERVLSKIPGLESKIDGLSRQLTMEGSKVSDLEEFQTKLIAWFVGGQVAAGAVATFFVFFLQRIGVL